MPNNKKFKGKRFPKDKDGGDKGKDQPSKFGCNDIKWWMTSEQLLKDVARLPFGRPIGVKYPLGYLEGAPTQTDDVQTYPVSRDLVEPGICVFDYKNAIGGSYDAASAINVAARALYSYVRHANNGHTNYESPDLLTYILACGEIYTAISYLEKVYGCAQYWSQRNRYFGTKLITALGFDPDDVFDNLADFRAGINLLIAKVNALAVPKDISLYERRFFLSGLVFKDQDIAKCQLYTFKPISVGCYSGTFFKTGSAIVPVDAPWRTYTRIDGALSFVRDLIDQLLSDEDIGIMGGDIMKAFGQGDSAKLHVLLPIPDEYTISPVYSEEMMQQIHNIMFTAAPGYYAPSVAFVNAQASVGIANINTLKTTYLGVVAQLNGSIVEAEGVRTGAKYSFVGHNDSNNNVVPINIQCPHASGLFLDLFKEDPDPADVMIATRLQYWVDTSGTAAFQGTAYYSIKCGTETIIRANVYTGDNYDVLDTNIIPILALMPSAYDGATWHLWSINNNDLFSNIRAALSLLKFHRCPNLFYTLWEGGQSASAVSELISVANIHHLTDVEVAYSEPNDTSTLDTLHESAILSVFRVPDLGLYKL